MRDGINDVTKRHNPRCPASCFVNRTRDSLDTFVESCCLENNIEGRPRVTHIVKQIGDLDYFAKHLKVPRVLKDNT